MAVFNKTAVKLWQIPRNVYRQALFPYSHLVTKVKPQGKLGEYLYKELHTLMSRVGRIGETYILEIVLWFFLLPCNLILKQIHLQVFMR
jgi:hypothetical protein